MTWGTRTVVIQALLLLGVTLLNDQAAANIACIRHEAIHRRPLARRFVDDFEIFKHRMNQLITKSGHDYEVAMDNLMFQLDYNHHVYLELLKSRCKRLIETKVIDEACEPLKKHADVFIESDLKPVEIHHLCMYNSYCKKLPEEPSLGQRFLWTIQGLGFSCFGSSTAEEKRRQSHLEDEVAHKTRA